MFGVGLPKSTNLNQRRSLPNYIHHSVKNTDRIKTILSNMMLQTTWGKVTLIWVQIPTYSCLIAKANRKSGWFTQTIGVICCWLAECDNYVVIVE